MHSTREKSKKKKTYYSNLSLQTQLREKKRNNTGPTHGSYPYFFFFSNGFATVYVQKK